MKKKLDYHTVFSVSHVSLSFDGRIKRSLNILCRIKKRVVIINPLDAEENDAFLKSGLDNKINLKKAGLSGSFSYFPYIFDVSIFLKLLFSKAYYIHCHDVNTAFMGLMCSKLRGQFIICDLHEWKSQTILPDKKNSTFVCKIYKLIEKIIFLDSDCVIHVNKKISDLMQKNLNTKRNTQIVKNIPEIKPLKKVNLRKKMNIAHDKFIIYYIGQLAPYRNLDFIINDIYSLSDVILVMQGTISDTYRKHLEKIVKNLSMSDRFFLLPPISHDDIPSWCNGANVGIFTCDHHNSESMKYSLPNKLFEYILGEIPMISDDTPLVREYVHKNDVGLLIDSNQPGTLCQAVKKFLDKDFYNIKYQNVKKAKKELCKNEENYYVYQKIYKEDFINESS